MSAQEATPVGVGLHVRGGNLVDGFDEDKRETRGERRDVVEEMGIYAMLFEWILEPVSLQWVEVATC